MALAIFLFTLLGHLIIWVGLANRLHSCSVPQWFNKLGSYVCHLSLVFLPLAIAVYELSGDEPTQSTNPMFARAGLPSLYYVYCWAAAGIYLSWWLVWRLTTRTTPLQLVTRTTVIDVAERLGARPAGNAFGRFFSGLPGNQVFQIHVQEKELLLPNLTSELDGLSIAHVSDWHFKGRIDKPYFEEVVRAVNELDCDLIALTGDYFDAPQFLDWIPDTFAKLRARHGVYFIFGNHDARHGFYVPGEERLSAAGLIYLGHEPKTLEIRGQRVYLAGNERPWLPLSPKLEAVHSPPAQTSPANPHPPNPPPKHKPTAKTKGSAGQRPAEASPAVHASRSTLRILLSHSPDQFRWAREHRFDLMLAGHTHGGQVRLPLIGAIYCPSWHGVKYARGAFYKPPTLLHVTHGIGSEMPLRYNCPPEIAKLILRAPERA